MYKYRRSDHRSIPPPRPASSFLCKGPTLIHYFFSLLGSGRMPSSSNRLRASSRAQVETLYVIVSNTIRLPKCRNVINGHWDPNVIDNSRSHGVLTINPPLASQWPTFFSVFTHVVSGLNANATPVASRLAPNRYIGHSHPSGSGFSPGLMPQSQPVGGSNWDSLPWPPPCRRVVKEKDRAAAGWRAQRAARSGATAWRMRAMVGGGRDVDEVRGREMGCAGLNGWVRRDADWAGVETGGSSGEVQLPGDRNLIHVTWIEVIGPRLWAVGDIHTPSIFMLVGLWAKNLNLMDWMRNGVSSS